MLVFKNNIYSSAGQFPSPLTPDPGYNLSFDIQHLIKVTFKQEEETLSFIQRQHYIYWKEDLLQFYPHSGKTNNLYSLQETLNILKFGLNETSCWHLMNSYHFCFLYDALMRFSFNYNHDNLQEKLAQLPELEGRPLQIGNIINNYFFNTLFLTNAAHFNSLDAEIKYTLGYKCPQLFGVINGLAPTKDEIALKKTKDFPYNVYV